MSMLSTTSIKWMLMSECFTVLIKYQTKVLAMFSCQVKRHSEMYWVSIDPEM